MVFIIIIKSVRAHKVNLTIIIIKVALFKCMKKLKRIINAFNYFVMFCEHWRKFNDLIKSLQICDASFRKACPLITLVGLYKD